MLFLRRANRELLALVGLFALFVVTALFYERVGQEATAPDTPSAFNAAPSGVKALYRLLVKQGYAVERLTAPWDVLDAGTGLLVFVEPNERAVRPREINALRAWVTRGGSVLYFVSGPARPADARDPLFGDVSVVAAPPAPQTLSPAPIVAALTRDVHSLAVKPAIRLQTSLATDPAKGYVPLLADAQGGLLLYRRLGKGQLIVAADANMTSNQGIREADNAIFLINVAAASLSPASAPASNGNGTGAGRRVIAFDEYHHGVGFARGRGETGQFGKLFNSAPLGLRLVLWHGLAFGLLLLYNGNRRFGRVRTLSTPAFRAGTDYVISMARLLRRARAGDIAITTLFTRFLRDLARSLDAPPETSPGELARLAERRFNLTNNGLEQLTARCVVVTEGEKISESELITLARRIEQARRECHLAGVG